MTDFTMNMNGIEIEADDETGRVAFVGKARGPSKFKAELEKAVANGEKAVDAEEIGRRAGTRGAWPTCWPRQEKCNEG